MQEPKMNFNNLPTSSQGNVTDGPNNLVILKATKELTKDGKPMITLQVAPVQQQNLIIYDRFVLFNQKYEPEAFGQYKLRKLMEAVNYIPTKDFTMDILCQVLPGMKFSANLEYEEGTNGKEYLGIKDVESYGPVFTELPSEKSTETKPVTPQDFVESKDEEIDEEVINELDEDDDII